MWSVLAFVLGAGFTFAVVRYRQRRVWHRRLDRSMKPLVAAGIVRRIRAGEYAVPQMRLGGA